MSIDLHIHSTSSDGTMSPVELVTFASQKGLSAIAITDHDTIDGLEEAVSAGERIGLEVVPGIELSVKFGPYNVHLLGYLFDFHQKELNIALAKIQAGRLERNKKIVAKLNSLGVPIQFSELKKKLGSGQTGRPHIAKILVQKRVVQNMDEAFAKYLGQDGLAYISRLIYPVEEAIELIKNAGGLAVLAHPLQLERAVDDLGYALNQLREMGLDGIEVYYPNHSRKFRKQLILFAEQLSLLKTGGSDYHGSIRPGTTLAGGKNVSVPAELLVEMRQQLVNSNK